MLSALTRPVLVLALATIAVAARADSRIPLDTQVAQHLARRAEEYGELAVISGAYYERNVEYSVVGGADAAAVGIVSKPTCYRGRFNTMTMWNLTVEEGVYGCSTGDTLSFSVMGGTLDGTTHAVSIAPRLMQGDRVLVLLERPDFSDPAKYFVGSDKCVYHIADNRILRKDIPVSGFATVVQEIMAAREPERLFFLADEVLVGSVMGTQETSEADTLPWGIRWERSTSIASLDVTECLKGVVAPGETLSISVPNETGIMRFGRPEFQVGESALVFLVHASGGKYRVLEDTAGKYRLRLRDDMESLGESERVLAALRALAGGQPN